MDEQLVFKYWYIAYVGVPSNSQKKKLDAKTLTGATVLRDPRPDLMIGEATIGLRQVNRFQSLVITNWQQITEAQYKEYLMVLFGHDPDAKPETEDDPSPTTIAVMPDDKDIEN